MPTAAEKTWRPWLPQARTIPAPSMRQGRSAAGGQGSLLMTAKPFNAGRASLQAERFSTLPRVLLPCQNGYYDSNIKVLLIVVKVVIVVVKVKSRVLRRLYRSS